MPQLALDDDVNLRAVRRALRATMLAATLGAPLAAAAQSAPAPPLPAAIEQVMARPEFRHATFGVAVWSLDSNRMVYARDADKLFVPGSTTKLLTEGTALELLGADYRFHTKVYRTGTVGRDGTLDGDLVLVASGDPNLSGRIGANGTLAFTDEDHSYGGSPDTRAVPGDPLLVIRELARQVRAHGVKRVRGRVLVDARLFPEGERELGTGVVISPIIVNDNVVDVTVTPGAAAGAPARLGVSPASAYVRFVNRTTTGAAGSAPSVDWSSDVTNPDGSHTVTATGSVPAGKPGVLFAYAVPEPSRFAAVTLAEALRREGVHVALPRAGPAPDFTKVSASYAPANLVAEHVSPPFAEEVKVTLKVSQNLHASMTPYLLGATLGRRAGDSARTGFDLEHDFLAKAGLDVSAAAQGDGAGGQALFTPDFMVHYLAYMARQPNFSIFYNALPVLGRDGTLAKIQPNSPAAGQVHAKTGTYAIGDPLNHRVIVTGKGLAGYVTTARGRRLAFAIYANNVPVPQEPDAIQEIVGQALGEIATAIYEATP